MLEKLLFCLPMALANIFFSVCFLRYAVFVFLESKCKIGSREFSVILGISCLVNMPLFLIVQLRMSIMMDVLISSFAVALEGTFLVRSRKEPARLMMLSLISATLLNFTGFYIMVFALCKIFLHSRREISGDMFGDLVLILTLVGAGGMIQFLRYSKHFPNEGLRTLYENKVERVALLAYLSFFSIGNIITMSLVIPGMMEASYKDDLLHNIYFDMMLKALLILFGSYFIVYYLCWNNKNKLEIAALSDSLRREEKYRRSVFDEAIAAYCVDLTKDCVVEGTGDDVMMKNGGEISYARFLAWNTAKCVHKDDLHKIEPFFTIDGIREHLEKRRTIEECVRISARAAAEKCAVKDMTDEKEKENYIKTSLGANPDEEWVWVRVRYSRTDDEETGKDYLYITISHIGDTERDAARYKEAAEHDSLTGLYNRAYFKKMMDEITHNRVEDACIYMIDVDGLKGVNDNFGHSEGDRMLVNISLALRNEFRERDVVARLGGDEFAVMSVGLRKIQTIEQRARNICEATRKVYISADGAEIHTGVSIGIAIYPLHGETTDEVLSNADKALYAIKRSKKGIYKLYDAKQS